MCANNCGSTSVKINEFLDIHSNLYDEDMGERK